MVVLCAIYADFLLYVYVLANSYSKFKCDKGNGAKRFVFKIGNYKQVNYISNNYIEICFTDYLIKLKGDVMKVVSLDDSEFYIQGKILNIELIYNV